MSEETQRCHFFLKLFENYFVKVHFMPKLNLGVDKPQRNLFARGIKVDF